MELSYLITEAEAFKGCADGISQLRSCESVEDLIKCYFDRIDYCLANDYPSNDFLMRYKDELSINGVFIDDKTDIVHPEKNTIVFLGDCISSISVGGFSVHRLYVKHNSKINVKAFGSAFIMIDALDTSDVIVDVQDGAKVIVNLYAQATCTGATKIIQKNKQTYDL